jgi:EAL domain-containing protein (putative c-di-GMP-specific phosphodiesterase class I)
MSKAKEAGGGRVEVFGPAMYAQAQRRAELAVDLREAIAEHRLGIEYQPVVEFATSRVRSVEALVRWSRAGEIVGWDELVGVAESSGLIVQLGDWLLREACRQVAAWRAGGFQVGLSVNFSFRQVSAPGFVTSVLAALDEAGLPPQALALEVAERVLIDSAGPMVADLAGLRGKGVSLAIDDFGTGYTSLGYLRQLTADIIKIDPSFIAGLGADPTRTLLTKTIVNLGHDLGIDVIAEGIERPEQVAQLEAMGCTLGQGPGIAGPAAAGRLEGASVELLASWREAGDSARLGEQVREQVGDAVGDHFGDGVGDQVGDPAYSPASRTLRSAHGARRANCGDRRRRHRSRGDR